MHKLRAPLFLLLLTAFQALIAEVLVPYDDPAFQYNGRVPMVAKGAELHWPGTYINFRVDSPSVEILLDDAKGRNYYNIIVNGNDDEPIVVGCEKGENVVTVDLGDEPGPKDVTIFKRTEAFWGETTFKGIKLPDGGKILPAPERPERKIEFYGDSITCGMGNEAPDDKGDRGDAIENNYLTYGAITARNLDAQYRVIARSGIGINVSYFPLTMPEMYDRLDPTNPDSKWDFSQWTPDVVVVNLFQNDASLIRKKLDPVPTPAQIVQSYVDFIKSIRKEYPDAHIVCSLGSMGAMRKGSHWPEHIENAVEKLKAQGDTNISVCFFPFEGWGKHPRVRHHQKNADILTAHIKEQMGW